MTKRDKEIIKVLSRIRTLRTLYISVLFSFLPILVLIMWYVERSGNLLAVSIPFVLFFSGIFVQHRLHRSRCPRCRDFFFVQSSADKNYMPLRSSTSFPPQKRCQKCGLTLYY